MRNNQPVTQRENNYPDDEILMSATDLKGRIIYVNKSFARVCKYFPSEMVGQPHNLIRHPDVPEAAYKDLWHNLETGRFWTGILKNRCKDGDFYWVRANVTPIYRDNRPVGYLSVRVKPTTKEVNTAKRVYRDYQRGKPSMVFHDGTLINTGIRGIFDKIQMLSMTAKLWGILTLITLLWLASAAVAGFTGFDFLRIASMAVIINVITGLVINWRFMDRLRPIMQQASYSAIGRPSHNRLLGDGDEVSVLQQAVTQSNLNMRTFISDVDQLINGINLAANEIADGSQQLSTQSENAANQINATNASMEELSGTVENNARDSGEAKELSKAAGVATTNAATIVKNTAEHIEQMNAANQKISGIISVINDIAFQTNLLALNASVEAARAGDAGSGFAVVASEVRSLAQRSANSAKEIGTIIGEVVELAQGSTQQAKKAVEAMDEMQVQNSKVEQLIDSIADAGRRQADGLINIQTSFSALNDLTHTTAAMAEQYSTAVHSMEEQIEVLSRAVGIFHSSRKDDTTYDEQPLAAIEA